MAKVFSVIPIELRPGVSGADFENFFRDKYAPLGEKLGWKGYVLKGDRGERDGKLAVIWEIPSVELLESQIPKGGEITEEALRLLGPDFKRLSDQLDTYIQGWPNTDYVVMEG